MWTLQTPCAATNNALPHGEFQAAKRPLWDTHTSKFAHEAGKAKHFDVVPISRASSNIRNCLALLLEGRGFFSLINGQRWQAICHHNPEHERKVPAVLYAERLTPKESIASSQSLSGSRLPDFCEGRTSGAQSAAGPLQNIGRRLSGQSAKRVVQKTGSLTNTISR